MNRCISILLSLTVTYYFNSIYVSVLISHRDAYKRRVILNEYVTLLTNIRQIKAFILNKS